MSGKKLLISLIVLAFLSLSLAACDSVSILSSLAAIGNPNEILRIPTSDTAIHEVNGISVQIRTDDVQDGAITINVGGKDVEIERGGRKQVFVQGGFIGVYFTTNYEVCFWYTSD